MPLTVQCDECRQMQDAARLRVDRAAPVHVAVPNLARQRVRVPVIRIRRYDINVVEEHEGGLVAAIEPSPDVAPAWSRLGNLVVDAFSLEDLREEPRAGNLVTRRIHGVGADVVL